MAGMLPDHDRIDRLDAVHHTAKVHVQDVVPVIQRVGVDLACHPDARIVEEVVDSLRLLHHLGDGMLERRVVANVELDRVRLRATTGEALRKLIGSVDLTIGDPYLRPGGGQRGRQRGTDAGCAAGDENDLP